MSGIEEDPKLTRVVRTVRLVYKSYQSCQAELRDAVAHAEANRWRDALMSAERAWEYFGQWVAAALGMPTEDQDLIRRRRRTFGLDGDDARKFYVTATGDAIGSHPRWHDLDVSRKLRDSAEHDGAPVSEREAWDGIGVRWVLMEHVMATLLAVPDIDVQQVKRVRRTFDGIVPKPLP